MYEQVFHYNPDYDCVPSGSECICINCKTGNWIKLNATSVKLYHQINNKPLGQVMDNLSKELSFPLEATKSIFDPILSQFITSQLIICNNPNFHVGEKKQIESGLTTYPKQIWIHIIDACNLSCPYCYYRANRFSEFSVGHCVDSQKLFAFLSAIPEDERENVTISGGEPFLNPNLLEIVTFLKDTLHFKEVFLISNGTVRHDLYNQILPHVDQLQLSMDGTTKEIHERIRGTGNYDKLLEGIKTATDLDFTGLRVSYTLSMDNVDDLQNLPLFAYEKGISSIHINKLLRVGKNLSESGQSITWKDYSAAIKVFRENLKEVNYEINYERELKQVGMEKRRPFISYTDSFDLSSKVNVAGKLIGCGMGVGMISIDADGSVYPCPSLHHREFMLGSLDAPYHEVKEQGQKFSLKYNIDNHAVECFACKYKYFCGGGCRAEAFANGNIMGQYSDCETFSSHLLQSIADQ